MSDEEPSALQIAQAVSTYLSEELTLNDDVFVPVHRDIAVCALGIVNAAIESLEEQVVPLQ